MEKSCIWTIIFLSIIVNSCQIATRPERDVDVNGSEKTNTEENAYGRYYAPTNYILGQEQTMLSTAYATLDVIPSNGKADIVFCFKDSFSDMNSIDQFTFEFSSVQFQQNGSVGSFNEESVEGVISYTMGIGFEQRKSGAIIRDFAISGMVDKSNPANSKVLFTSKILDRILTLSLENMTSDESAAVFGNQGYPDGGGEIMTDTKRVFVNDSGHDVTVRHESSGNPDCFIADIKAGMSAVYYLFDEDDIPSTKQPAYVLIFDDGRVSTHEHAGVLNPREKRLEYSGLPIEVKSIPFLSFECGHIYYEIRYNCTYTITREIYDEATIPEQ